MRNRTNFFRANREMRSKRRDAKNCLSSKNFNLCLLDSVKRRKKEVRRMRNRTNFFRAKHENEVEAQRSEKLPIKQKMSTFVYLTL